MEKNVDVLSVTKVLKFISKYKSKKNTAENSASIKIIIPFKEDCISKLIVQLYIQEDSVMRCLDESLKISLKKLIQRENQKLLDDLADQLVKRSCNEKTDLENIIHETERRYKDELIHFAERVGTKDEDIFAQNFHRLVHFSSLEDILKKERTYANVIFEMMNYMDNEVESLNLFQQKEMELKINQLDITTTTEDINDLLTQQYATQHFLRKRFESELDAKKGHQKNEYRMWITSQVSQMVQKSPISTPLGNRSSTFFSQQPSMEESFTIHLGSQLKHMHNIRILSANVTDFCSPLHGNESLNGLNMALGLYSSSLCAVVVLTPSMQKQPNKSIIKNANMSTEFHFEQIDDQLANIEKQIRGLNNNDLCANSADIINGTSGTTSSTHNKPLSKLKTGDFFITKHSNLSQSHIIFHLVSDEPINSPSEINSRHPVILGLRNILKTASRHDVITLTIPALLRHEMSEDMTVQWCMRRAELVFKCAKGFMIESASWGGAELSTLQLLLPNDISEELFNSLAGMVPNVFRLANPKILVDKNN